MNSGEQLLVRDAIGGDTTAFAELYDAFSQRIYNFVYRSVRDAHLAEDICQEVWLKVYREIATLRSPEAFSVWLYRLATRACTDFFRRERPAEELPDALADSHAGGPESSALSSEKVRFAWEALGALPARQNFALYLRQVEDRSYREIAAVLDCPESAVETLLFRARRAFSRAYEDLETSPANRCKNARRVMSATLDREATPFEQRTVESHLAECRTCRAEVKRFTAADKAYAALPLAALPASLVRLAAEIGGSSGVAAGSGLLAKFLALFAGKTAVAVLLTTAAAGLAGTALFGGDFAKAGVAGPDATAQSSQPAGTAASSEAGLSGGSSGPTSTADGDARRGLASATGPASAGAQAVSAVTAATAAPPAQAAVTARGAPVGGGSSVSPESPGGSPPPLPPASVLDAVLPPSVDQLGGAAAAVLEIVLPPIDQTLDQLTTATNSALESTATLASGTLAGVPAAQTAQSLTSVVATAAPAIPTVTNSLLNLPATVVPAAPKLPILPTVTVPSLPLSSPSSPAPANTPTPVAPAVLLNVAPIVPTVAVPPLLPLVPTVTNGLPPLLDGLLH